MQPLTNEMKYMVIAKHVRVKMLTKLEMSPAHFYCTAPAPHRKIFASTALHLRCTT